jgi:hypothetical protein
VAEWTDSDAWIFACLPGPGADRGVALWQVLLRADAINHLSLGETDFTTAAGRLIGAGLMGADVAGDRYWLTDEGYSLRGRLLPDPRKYNWHEVVLPGLRRLGAPTSNVLTLPAGSFARAARRHRKESVARWRRIQAGE